MIDGGFLSEAANLGLVGHIKASYSFIFLNFYLSGGGEISFGERRGAAYGLAGFVKGLGILSLKQLDIMGKLTNAVTDKKQPKARYAYIDFSIVFL